MKNQFLARVLKETTAASRNNVARRLVDRAGPPAKRRPSLKCKVFSTQESEATHEDKAEGHKETSGRSNALPIIAALPD